MTTFSIRLATNEDKWMVLDWRNHPDVRAVMLTNHVIQREEHSTWWDTTLASEDRCLLILERLGQPVGVIIFNRIDQIKKTAWWAFYLDNASLEKDNKIEIWFEAEKLALDYAGNTLNLHEMYGDVVDENEAVFELHKKFGFEECEPPAGLVETNRSIRYLKYTWTKNKPDLRARLYLCASHNTDFLTDALCRKSGHYLQFPYQIKKLEFGRYQLDLLDESSVELNHQDSCYVFLERIEDLFPDIYTLPTESSLLETEKRIAEYLSFIRQIATRGNNKIYVADFCIQKGFPYSLEEQFTGSKVQRLVGDWNDSLQALKAENLIEIVPYSQVIQRVGHSFSNKYWYMARAPFSIQCLEAYSQAIIGSVFASQALSARALILDLDNTLWQGVIGDDGLEGIALGGDYPGNIYKELQSLFLALKERGILLSICSKNTEQVALDAIESHPEMRLKKSDFVAHRINWAPKSQNIKELAQELNLGVQSLCFIDDNPVERAEVRRNIPGIFVPELPEDPADWYDYICHLPELYVVQVNESDKRRAELYKKRVDIQKAQANFADRNEFLASLEMDVRIEPLSESNFDRTYQLFSKTNQFNTTTTRYSKEELQKWLGSNQRLVLHVQAKDKYSSEYEGVAALVIICDNKKWVIDNFVMSCRVMGRDIENVILEQLIHQAKAINISSVIGRYVKSQKNMPVEHLYSKNDFEKQNDDCWLFDLDNKPLPERTEVMKLHWNM
ncbi:MULTISPECIES: HAD-IIIC family phosphatase [Vibrio harveyi group]|uniref:HAD-IIIC family phosphatase n=1 Tax=Vibrio harveyi group TaxID=717610 RepID=UPI0003A66D72|nr:MULTISPECIES: HAD-IIIC family phosphatase [Vibrio harveyi group]PAW11030.1 GNAT family N-acetyltransferase [Vibrio sp. V1B]